MMLAAIASGVPAVLFEPNVQPGFTNGVLGRLARRVAVAHQETVARWAPKSVLTGCPVRPEFFQAPVREHQRPLRLLVTGGSQGSRAINRAMLAALDGLAARQSDLAVVHQTGEREFPAIRDGYRERGFTADVRPFLEDMPARFAAADLIVCRAGAITVAEIAAAGRAALFIPFGAATDSHQLGNARAMEQAGAGRVVTEAELSGERLAKEILEFVDRPERLTEMERRAKALGRPRAIEAIADLLEEVARQ
jgi:UDP-N-acetylglucosamine--N-acetylmuramyl-(pentapeptide) pyrophosphoryl-undecaprenol N-acetylglucosamine transferase